MIRINSFFLAINRHVRSIFYRMILLVYGIILSVLFPTFSVYTYCAIFFLYTVYLRIYIVKHNPTNAVVRSIIDLLFIVFCLYGKPLDNICVIAMLFLPVANAINHTGKGKHSYIYVIGLISIYFFLLLSGDYDNTNMHILYAIIAFSAFLAIQWFTAKNWLNNNREAILKDAVEDFYIHGIKHDEVYKKIGLMFLEEKDPFLDMFCFISHDDFKTLFIVNGTQFVYNYSVKINDEQLQELRENSMCTDLSLSVDDDSYNHNIVIAEPATLFRDNNDDTSYMFVICFDSTTISNMWMVQNISRVLSRFSQYLYSERRMRLRKKENFEQMKDKGRFVDSAINTMHFIKNRLSSLQALTDVVNEMDPTDIDNDYIDVAKEAAKRSNIDIQSILQKAKYLLNKENNPFHYQPTERCKPRKMFATLRQVWENVLSDSIITVDNIERLNDESYNIDTNMEGVEILFSDIIGNMYKYQKKQSTCLCTCDDKYLTIMFKNDFEDKSAVLSLVDTYNQKDKEEIIKRKTFGVSNIKSFVSDMGIELFSSIGLDNDTEVFAITIKFKLIKDESSNN